jgi:hypothetical protein
LVAAEGRAKNFAPLRELFDSRKGAKLAKRQSVRLVFGCGSAALGIFWSGVQTLFHRRKVGGDLPQSGK